MAVELKKGIYWVGAIDWNLRDFHGYVTGRGATYNCYLIIDEKVTLIDTVKAPFYEEMLSRIKQIIDPSKIDYLVSNHLELDHSGSIPLFKRDFKLAVGTDMRYKRTNFEKKTVETGSWECSMPKMLPEYSKKI